MKEYYLTILRDASTKPKLFRQAARELSRLLAAEASQILPMQTVSVQTPLEATSGKRPAQRVVLTTILRSGLAMLPSFEELFPEAPIGFFGMRRDEKTAIAYLYYQNLPKITKNDFVFLIDPMLATGGSSTLALSKLVEAGAIVDQICLVSIISAKNGVEKIHRQFPQVKIITAATDPSLNDKKFIVPGLGDFGDRYFDTVVEKHP